MSWGPSMYPEPITKRWNRYCFLLECYEQARRYLIKLESGMIIRRNRIHLRKRFVSVDVTGMPSVVTTPTVSPSVAPAPVISETSE